MFKLITASLTECISTGYQIITKTVKLQWLVENHFQNVRVSLSVKIHTTYLLQMTYEWMGNHIEKQQDYTRNYSMQQKNVVPPAKQ
jgi:hypothetical protein